MGDIKGKDNSPTRKITGKDELFEVDVIRSNGDRILVQGDFAPVGFNDRFFLSAEDAGSSTDLAVNGTTPVPFFIKAEQGIGARDLVVSELRLSGFDNGVKIDKFLALNSALTNGVQVDINIPSSGNMVSFFPIKTTADFERHFAFGNGGRFQIFIGSGNDFVTATYSPETPFVLKKDTLDEIVVTVQDNLNTVASLEFTAFGTRVN